MKILSNRKFRKFLTWSTYIIAFGATLILATANPASANNAIIVAIAVILVSPVALVIAVQLCFWTYHWMRHGDPFYEPGDVDRRCNQKGFITLDMYRHDTKKLCPICKRKTHCSFNSGKDGSIPFHRQRN